MSLLEGCLVLDLGIITAGAATSALLADFGADVVKVESPTYRDPFRIWAGDARHDEADMLPPLFRATNRNKRAISIDLKRTEGRAVLLRLATRADVVVENFRRGVMANLGLSFDALRAANPGIVLASVSSHGETGPDAGHVSYGSTLEALSGLAWVTGYAGGKPEVSGRDVNYPDQIVALFAAGMIASALRAVRQSGCGTHLDISQRDLAAFLIGDLFVAASSGEAVSRQGNAQAASPLQDCFRAADGRWIALTVHARERERLATALPSPEPASPEALRAAIAAEVGCRPGDDAVAFLTGIGLSAAPVLDGGGVLARHGAEWSHAMLHEPGGAMVKGFPVQVEEMPLEIRHPAPGVGAHTRQVLETVGGYNASENDALAAAGVIEHGG
jgi:crotonobetainyl-CoA:carnitine CoA-transferase CaiB-like acyl-CoA transferase